jgi:hypothetical protein
MRVEWRSQLSGARRRLTAHELLTSNTLLGKEYGIEG